MVNRAFLAYLLRTLFFFFLMLVRKEKEKSKRGRKKRNLWCEKAGESWGPSWGCPSADLKAGSFLEAG